MTRGFYVGRFQPLHKGHISVIEKALTEVDELIIGIGSSQYGYTKTNPFTLEERIEMIEKSVTGNYKIVPIPDLDDFPAWVAHVEKITPKFDVVYTGSPITKELFHQAGYDVRDIVLTAGPSGTKIRELITKGDESWKDHVNEETAEVIQKRFGEERIKHLYINEKYPKPTMTVDGIIEYNDGIVLIKRKNTPYSNMYALPGGHVETGENVEKAVVREIEEETGLEFKIKGFLGVYSDLGRDPRGYYATTVFYGEGKGELKAGDDASEVIVIKDVKDKLAFDHNKILEDYRGRVRKDGS